MQEKLLNFPRKFNFKFKEITSMNNEELKIMGRRGREFLKENYDIDKIILDYIEFYKEVLNK